MTDSHTKVLDSSTLIALVGKETGWENVLPLLPESMMSSVNVAEVAKFLIEKKKTPKSVAQEVIEKLIAVSVPFNNEQAYITADLTIQTQKYGLSLGDRACLALALTQGGVVYTADKIWKSLELENIEIRLIR